MTDPTEGPQGDTAKEARMAEALRKLDALSREQILARARLEGWSESQAGWLNVLAKEPLVQAVVDGTPPEQAIQDAYLQARRRLTVSYFENALNEGKNRITAFLTVIDLEKQLAERRGDKPPAYPDTVLMAACGAVEQAAMAGRATEEQVAAGFDMLRSQLAIGGAEPPAGPRH
ncbi:hypothetical protein [Pseudoroseomonas cervicalis]|uniref:hypothetical protein n=1 Tax=Teichococcus cervicalis TaxID=204525 RepID=UPI00277F0647|nr:hypothetical protein [Pseudoroseomonas cervicalis]MDQ1080077.1 hypothetical protein [Pseudoroseomonas cervicalis]